MNLAVALAQRGARVGLMDADIYGPNVPRMMGVNAPPAVVNEKIIPLEAHGVKVISLGFLIERDQPAIWRGPIVMKIVTQFLRDVAWGELDYFLVDMPPGTGDAQLSLVQATQVHGAIIVTTPQEVAVGDALRGVKMFQRVNVPVLGIVENMSWFECPHCGKPTALFGTGGGERLAKEVGSAVAGADAAVSARDGRRRPRRSDRRQRPRVGRSARDRDSRRSRDGGVRHRDRSGGRRARAHHAFHRLRDGRRLRRRDEGRPV